MPKEQEIAEIADRIVAMVKPAFAGKPPPAQGWALCELLAIWLNGHRIDGDAKAEADLRREILTAHVRSVCALVPQLDADEILDSSAEA